MSETQGLSGNTSDSCVGSTTFSLAGTMTVAEVHVFPQSLQAHPRAVPHLVHNCFFPHPFKFIIL
jgi:hypothetical protein